MKILKKILLFIAILGIADTLCVLCIRGGINLGTLLPGGCGIAVMCWLALMRNKTPDLSFLRRFSLQSILFYLFCLGVLSFAAVQVLILSHAFLPDVQETDWCIVLGAGLNNGKPNHSLQTRLSTAADYLQKYPSAKVIVSGGLDFGETITEAEAMQKYLVEKGISPTRIYQEDKATSTLENLRFSKAIIDGTGTSSSSRISVISNEFHLFRVRMLAKRLDMDVALIPAPSPWYLLPNVCIREYFALAKSYVLDR